MRKSPHGKKPIKGDKSPQRNLLQKVDKQWGHFQKATLENESPTQCFPSIYLTVNFIILNLFLFKNFKLVFFSFSIRGGANKMFEVLSKTFEVLLKTLLLNQYCSKIAILLQEMSQQRLSFFTCGQESNNSQPLQKSKVCFFFYGWQDSQHWNWKGPCLCM